jgi:hypothetical protein
MPDAATVGMMRALNRNVARVRSLRPVPELTRSADIQLNKRLSLRRRLEMLSQPQIVD